jgi:hypothetical protein
LDPTPTSFDDDRAFENTLLAAKRLITSVMPLDTEKDTVWGMVYKLITSGRQEGSLCTNRSTSRVQSAQAFANMMHGLEDGRLDSIYELALGNELNRITLETLKNYRELREHGDLREQRDLAAHSH